jgi:hypothetical protein
MPAKAIVPSSTAPIAAGQLVAPGDQPSSSRRPAPGSANCTISTTATAAILAAISRPRPSGVAPSRLSTW